MKGDDNMFKPFIRTTHYPEQRTVMNLEVINETIKCKCKCNLQKIKPYTYFCNGCREEFMGPLLTM